MKTLGMIGGMSWESTTEYYKIINQLTQKKLGSLHSCKCLLYSVEFAEIGLLLQNENWKEIGDIMSDISQKLEQAGADLIILCTNTIHNCSKAITENISVPFLHIAEATGLEIASQKIKKVGLLGTRPTMEKDFYKEKLNKKFDIQTVIPQPKDRKKIHEIIFNELVQGVFRDESKEYIKSIINELNSAGAEGIILGCTELPLLISDKDIDIPVFNTTELHARKAVEWVLKD
jgi:aspartate racemase